MTAGQPEPFKGQEAKGMRTFTIQLLPLQLYQVYICLRSMDQNLTKTIETGVYSHASDSLNAFTSAHKNALFVLTKLTVSLSFANFIIIIKSFLYSKPEM